MDNYERLRESLDAHPATAPKTQSIDEILHLLFTPEEAAVAANMTYKPKDAASIALKTGIEANKVLENLESMADKGIIFSRNKNGDKLYGRLDAFLKLMQG